MLVNHDVEYTRTMTAFYSVKELDNGVFYVFDPTASDREITQIIGYWNDYMGWGDIDYVQMLSDYQLTDLDSELRRNSELGQESFQNLSNVNLEIDLSEPFEQLGDLYGVNRGENSEYWNTFTWTLTTDNGINTFTLKNGTKIETTSLFNDFTFNTTSNTESPYGFMKPAESVTIRFANGVTITTSGGTTIKATCLQDAEHELEIIIGIGNAIITQSDGISSTVLSGTVLDSEGNVI